AVPSPAASGAEVTAAPVPEIVSSWSAMARYSVTPEAPAPYDSSSGSCCALAPGAKPRASTAVVARMAAIRLNIGVLPVGLCPWCLVVVAAGERRWRDDAGGAPSAPVGSPRNRQILPRPGRAEGILGANRPLPVEPEGQSDSTRIVTVRDTRRSPTSPPDRKSTRLNSSHVKISYAVFCLKKKNPHTDAHDNE